MKWLLFISIILSSHFSFSQYKIEMADSNTFSLGEGVVLSKTSFRGLSVVDDQHIWVSGSRGTIARSTDGGKTFSFQQLKNYPKSDFRDIEAFDDKRAIIMSSGTPAYILKTVDGGQTWKEVYKNMDTAYFLDAMDFWDEERGMLVGDPIHRRFVLLQTHDGGETWNELDTNKTLKALEGEAVFAASGTSLRCWGKKEAGFVSGGLRSEFYESTDYGDSWSGGNASTIPGGTVSRGSFSFFKEGNKESDRVFVAGGDYHMKDSVFTQVFYSGKLNGEISYQSRDKDVYAIAIVELPDPNSENTIFTHIGLPKYKYISCIEKINKNLMIACSPEHTFICKKPFAWKWDKDLFKINEGFHVVRKAKKGNAVFLAGPKGKIGRLIY